jgi:hypothetical protein
MIRYEAAIDPTLFASEVNFRSSTIEVMQQGTTTRADRKTPTPDTQVRSNCDAALRACRNILIQAAPTSGIAARCRILRWSLPLVLAAAIALILLGMLAPRALVRACPYPPILDFLPWHWMLRINEKIKNKRETEYLPYIICQLVLESRQIWKSATPKLQRVSVDLTAWKW